MENSTSNKSNYEAMYNVVTELGFNCNMHIARTGSKYITISCPKTQTQEKFRYSDHVQPSHYVCRNYTTISSYLDIIDVVSNPSWIVNEITYQVIDGEKYAIQFCNDTGGFKMIPC